MGPYLISHREFTPGAAILSHRDEAQIPWGVIRLEFRDEKSVMGSISPRGPQRDNSAVQSGYRIAQQNCLRCHKMGSYGGDKAQHPGSCFPPGQQHHRNILRLTFAIRSRGIHKRKCRETLPMMSRRLEH